jgi:hypothetical protein
MPPTERQQMARVKVKLAINLQDLEDAIQSAIENASVEGTGPDSASNYEVDSVEVSINDKGEIEAIVGCQHLEGKWATTDEVADEIINTMDTDIQISIEAVQS